MSEVRDDNLKVLYFGIYSKGIEYPRNNNLIRALRLNGVEVIELHFKLAESFEKRLSAIQNPIKAIKIFFGVLVSLASLSLRFIKVPPVDVVIVGHPAYFHIHLASLLCKVFQKKAMLINDVFIPLYEALVEDRKLVPQDSILGRFLYRFERSCCRSADLCFIDTETHKQYLVDAYGLPVEKVLSVYVGATIDQRSCSYSVQEQETFNVIFVGTFIPLHGIDTILNAAKYLQGDHSIKFSIVGVGQLRQDMEELSSDWRLTNVTFHDWIPTDKLGQFISSCDLALGIFGRTPKTLRVIPSKIFDICAVGVPFITSDTPALREVFSHRKNAYLVAPGDPIALADAIVDLKEDADLRKLIAEGAKKVGEKFFSLQEVGHGLLAAISERIKNK
jgi:glycosyltransferase involved in cell wall biosynthesis